MPPIPRSNQWLTFPQVAKTAAGTAAQAAARGLPRLAARPLLGGVPHQLSARAAWRQALERRDYVVVAVDGVFVGVRESSPMNASSARRSKISERRRLQARPTPRFSSPRDRCAVHRGSLAQALRLSPAPLRPAPAPAARAASAPTSTRNNAGSARSRSRPHASRSRCSGPGHGLGDHAMPTSSRCRHTASAQVRASEGSGFPHWETSLPQRRRAARAPSKPSTRSTANRH